METRKPLVVIDGALQELPAGDTLAIAGAPLFVQDAAPSAVGKYAWLQTNYLVAGGMTLWVEDGT